MYTSQSTATWVMTAYLLSASIFTPILGRIGDLVGKKRTLVAVLMVLTVGCLIAALAPTIGVLIVARVIQGFGGALFPLSFGIVTAGPIVSALDYRWLFWLPVGIVAVTALIAFRFVPKSPTRAEGRVNWLGAVLLSGWLVALLLPLSQATRWGWTSTRVIGLFVTAMALFALWLLDESRSCHPLIDMRIMRLRAVWTTNAAGLLFGAANYAIWSFVPGFAQTPRSAGYGFGTSVTGAGLLLTHDSDFHSPRHGRAHRLLNQTTSRPVEI